MPFCSFTEGAGMFDVTPIENMFLLEYLPTAPDNYLRVYLYARMLCLHPELGEGLEDMARVLNLEKDVVFAAFSYWERHGLMQRLTDNPPTYAVTPMRGAALFETPMDRDYYEYRDFDASLQSFFGGEKIIQPKDYEMARDWVDMMGFTKEAALRMVELQVKKSRAKSPDPHRVFLKVNEQAVRWSERGVRSVEDVEQAMEYDGQVERTAAAVMKRFSMHRSASVDEMNVVRRWLKEWNFTHDEIMDACAETTKSRTPTVAYLNSILETRRKGDGALFEGAKEVLRELGIRDASPTPDQMRSYGAMLSAGFRPETIRLAAVQCNRKKKMRFEELEWMIGKWGELGLFTFEKADAYVRNMQRVTSEVRLLLEKCGTDRRPQMDDLVLYEGWCERYPRELIDYAAECARGMQLPMRYIDKLLGEWQRSGVGSLDAARAQHASVGAARKAESAVNPALNYEQREYKDSDFGDDFFEDFSEEYEKYKQGGNEA